MFLINMIQWAILARLDIYVLLCPQYMNSDICTYVNLLRGTCDANPPQQSSHAWKKEVASKPLQPDETWSDNRGKL